MPIRIIGGCFTLILTALLFLSATTGLSRELNWDEQQLYYELGFLLGLDYATLRLSTIYANTKGRDTLPSQRLDDFVSRHINGHNIKPYMTNREKHYDDISDNLEKGFLLAGFSSPLWKDQDHRLGNLMTTFHAQNIWFFMNRILKYTVGRKRPKYHYTGSEEAYGIHSFPSGHTGQTFVMAFAIDRAFALPPWLRVGMYSLATSVAALRVTSNRHYFSDVLTGAGIAYLGVEAAYFLFEPKKRLDPKNSSQNQAWSLQFRPHPNGAASFDLAIDF